MDEPHPVIEMDRVTVSYRRHLALDEVSLTARPGSFLAIVGPNGAGKTTLLKTVLGLVRPSRGAVRVFGRAPWALGAARSRIGYVPQIPTTDPRFPVSAREAVLMGRFGRIGIGRRTTPADHEAARRAMARVGIEDLAAVPIGRLSGGQRQRMLVARALATDPDLLLLDEPTTGVDVAASESFYELLHRLHRDGLTILLVSHDIAVVARYADSVACINQRVAVHGRPDEVVSGAVLSCMYGPQAAFLGHGPVPHIVVGEHGEHLAAPSEGSQEDA